LCEKINARKVYFLFLPWEYFVMRSIEVYEKLQGVAMQTEGTRLNKTAIEP
jgi:hypothetical protein